MANTSVIKCVDVAQMIEVCARLVRENVLFSAEECQGTWFVTLTGGY